MRSAAEAAHDLLPAAKPIRSRIARYFIERLHGGWPVVRQNAMARGMRQIPAKWRNGFWRYMPMRPATQIVLVHDEPTARLVLRHSLEGRGIDVTEALDGIQAMRVASTNAPDCILLDSLMPRLDGIGPRRLIREPTELRRTPVVVLTGFSRVERGQVFADLGATAGLMKPFSFE